MTRLERRRAEGPPRSWTAKEEETLGKLLCDGVVGIKALCAALPGRSRAAIYCKKRRLRIRDDTFGQAYRAEKAEFTRDVAEKVTPKMVFEGYAGAGHQTFEWLREGTHVFAVDRSAVKIGKLKRRLVVQGFRGSEGTLPGWDGFSGNDGQRVSVYKGDAVDAAAAIRSAGMSMDLIDLDTCGSTIPTVGLFLQLLSPKYLTITHGEFHSYRFGREDVMRRVFVHRNIDKHYACANVNELAGELELAACVAAFRSHNETERSYWLELKKEIWLGPRNRAQMLRRFYRVVRPSATADCLNELAIRLGSLEQ